jgi:hypothetical protein
MNVEAIIEETISNYNSLNITKFRDSTIFRLTALKEQLYKRIVELESSLTKDIKVFNSSEKSIEFPQRIFLNKDTYLKFCDYKIYIKDEYIDYSFLFQKMLSLNLIYHVPHKIFFEWLDETCTLKDSTRDDFFKNSGFRSLSKSSSNLRVSNFNHVFKV